MSVRCTIFRLAAHKRCWGPSGQFIFNVRYWTKEFCDGWHQHRVAPMCLGICVAIIFYNGRKHALVPPALHLVFTIVKEVFEHNLKKIRACDLFCVQSECGNLEFWTFPVFIPVFNQISNNWTTVHIKITDGIFSHTYMWSYVIVIHPNIKL